MPVESLKNSFDQQKKYITKRLNLPLYKILGHTRNKCQKENLIKTTAACTACHLSVLAWQKLTEGLPIMFA
jgi:hypothetical protein